MKEKGGERRGGGDGMKGGAADGVGEGGRRGKKRCDEESWRWRSRGTQRLSVSGHNMRWILWQTA